MLGIITALGIFLGLALLIRGLAAIQIFWVYIPANTFAFVTYKGERTGQMQSGGGGVSDVLHNIPGKIIDKSNPDPFKWQFKNGDEKRGFLFFLLGVQWIGLFRSLRSNTIRGFRFGKKEREDRYHTLDTDEVTMFVPFSGEQAVEIKDAETNSMFGVDLGLNIIIERSCPLKSVVRIANANAVLAALLQGVIIQITATKTPEEILSSSDPKHKKDIIKAAITVNKEAMREIGVRMTNVALINVGVNEKHKDLFEITERRKREAAGVIEQAKGEKAKKLLENDAAADLFDRVTKPNLQLVNEPANNLAAAIKETKLGTLVIGGDATTMVGGQKK